MRKRRSRSTAFERSDEKIDIDCFSMCCASSASMEFESFVTLFDSSRQRRLFERWLTPDYLMNLASLAEEDDLALATQHSIVSSTEVDVLEGPPLTPDTGGATHSPAPQPPSVTVAAESEDPAQSALPRSVPPSRNLLVHKLEHRVEGIERRLDEGGRAVLAHVEALGEDLRVRLERLENSCNRRFDEVIGRTPRDGMSDCRKSKASAQVGDLKSSEVPRVEGSWSPLSRQLGGDSAGLLEIRELCSALSIRVGLLEEQLARSKDTVGGVAENSPSRSGRAGSHSRRGHSMPLFTSALSAHHVLRTAAIGAANAREEASGDRRQQQAGGPEANDDTSLESRTSPVSTDKPPPPSASDSGRAGGGGAMPGGAVTPSVTSDSGSHRGMASSAAFLARVEAMQKSVHRQTNL